MSVPGAPSAKEKKYDRQLRLWAANGQEALENAHVCLINATAVGTEILKNLILPGIGKYTIIDDAKVTEADLGVNFFLDDSCIGQPRAQKACELLQELNPDTSGDYICENISTLVLKDPTRLSSFTLVLVTGDLPTPILLSLDKLFYDMSIPLFVVKSLGFLITCRLALAEHTIIESHPDDITDLRLLQPFEALDALAKDRTKNLQDKDLMSNHDHGHVPYLLLLLKYLDDWKLAHDGQPPQNYSEKNTFKKMIREHMRTPDDENYEEAISAVLKNLNPALVPSSTRDIFEHERCIHLTPASSHFWIIARAISQFVYEKNDGLLPLPGALPDMKAESKGYIELQNLYKSKARQDLAQVMEYVKSLLISLQREPTEIAESEVETFCKHAGYAKVVHGRSLSQEYETDVRSKFIANHIDDPTSLMHYYLAVRAHQTFFDNLNHPPGVGDDSLQSDEARMVGMIDDLLKSNGITQDDTSKEASKNAVAEIARSAGTEIHNISSLAGGMVAQEIIKVITRQYVVMNNTVIFDGITSRSEVFVL